MLNFSFHAWSFAAPSCIVVSPWYYFQWRCWLFTAHALHELGNCPAERNYWRSIACYPHEVYHSLWCFLSLRATHAMRRCLHDMASSCSAIPRVDRCCAMPLCLARLKRVNQPGRCFEERPDVHGYSLWGACLSWERFVSDSKLPDVDFVVAEDNKFVFNLSMCSSWPFVYELIAFKSMSTIMWTPKTHNKCGEGLRERALCTARMLPESGKKPAVNKKAPSPLWNDWIVLTTLGQTCNVCSDSHGVKSTLTSKMYVSVQSESLRIFHCVAEVSFFCSVFFVGFHAARHQGQIQFSGFLFRSWISLAVLSTLFTIYWDLKHDWGLSLGADGKSFLRRDRVFSRKVDQIFMSRKIQQSCGMFPS